MICPEVSENSPFSELTSLLQARQNLVHCELLLILARNILMRLRRDNPIPLGLDDD